MAERSSNPRARARRLAVQAVYQWQMAGQDVADICVQFRADGEFGKADPDYFEGLVRGVVARRDELDGHIAPLLDRPLDEVDPVERAVLRLGTYELLARPEIPYRVVLNEAVELAKLYGAEQGHRYVNGVLDKLARLLRAQEAGADAHRPG